MNRFSHLKITALLLATVFVPSALLAWQGILAMANENRAERMMYALRDKVSFEEFESSLREGIHHVDDQLVKTLSQCVTVEALAALAQDTLLRFPFDQAVVTDRSGRFQQAFFRSAARFDPSSLPWAFPSSPILISNLPDSAGLAVQSNLIEPAWFSGVIVGAKFGTWQESSRFAASHWVGEGWTREQFLFVTPGSSAAAGCLVLRLNADEARSVYLQPARSKAGSLRRRCGLVPVLGTVFDEIMMRGDELPAPFDGLQPALLRFDQAQPWGVSRDLVIWSTVLLMAIGAVLTLSTAVRGIRLAQLQSDFVSTVSHELRTPLTSIAMFVEMLQLERYDDDVEKEEYFSIIQRETERLKRLIERVLNFSKLEKGTKRFEFRPEDIGEVVLDAVTTFREQHRGTAYDLELTILQNLSPVLLDRDSIGEVILNLLSNALKYSGDDPKIQLYIRERRTQVLVEVEDNGIGIRRRDRKRIFYKFYRADNSLAREVDGTGIGLAISKSIAVAHRGDLSVTSRVGRGSRFTLSLPKSLVDVGREPVGSLT